MIEVVFFDFGGVIAEEGWVNGLTDIAHHHGFFPPKFFDDACDVLWSTGYMYGKASENTFWTEFAKRYDFTMTVEDMRNAIFKRFVIRPEMIDLVKRVKAAGYRTAILSDQVNWLDEFNDRYGFFDLFDRVFNSYHMGTGKKDPKVFPLVCGEMHTVPENALFVDDSEGHIGRAKSCGLETVYFTDVKDSISEIEKILKL